ncbi:MAG: hypothetical protein CFE26_06850, partial [Verrucomicrobiales bacterium VVV1]
QRHGCQHRQPIFILPPRQTGRWLGGLGSGGDIGHLAKSLIIACLTRNAQCGITWHDPAAFDFHQDPLVIHPS